MRAPPLLLIAAFFLPADPAGAASRAVMPGPVEAEVARILDGDTVEVRAAVWLDQVLLVRVRIADIDAPELRRPRCAAERRAAAAARAFTEQFLADGRVTLTDIRHDKYAGRVRARLANGAGADLGEALIAAGHAQAYGAADWCSLES